LQAYLSVRVQDLMPVQTDGPSCPESDIERSIALSYCPAHAQNWWSAICEMNTNFRGLTYKTALSLPIFIHDLYGQHIN